MNIDLAEIEWEDISLDEALPRSRLLATVTLDGDNHHLEAIEVQRGESKFDQSAVCIRCNDILRRYEAVDPDAGPFNTVQIEGHTYVFFLTPFRY
jgi:hypothetical protein